MLDSLKQTGKTIGREISRAWENLSDGWRELLSRSSDALTHFGRHKEHTAQDSSALTAFPSWGLLAGEVEETSRDIVVRVELPGISKEDCQITIDGNVLHVTGEKTFERDTGDSTYHVMERAYGAFQRSIALPRKVSIDRAEARYSNGVLTVRLPKEGSDSARSIPVT